MTKFGWDLSNHDWGRHNVSLANAKSAGIDLVTHKATEGDFYQDPYFDDFARQLAAVSFPVAGSYHVLSGDIDIARQTDFWINCVNAKWPNWAQHPCPIWQIDAEPLDGHPAPSKAEIIACAERLVAKLHIQPTQVIVYGPEWVYGERLLGMPYHLWASSYVSGKGGYKSLYPGDTASQWHKYSGQTPLILQYTSSSTIGIQPTCDANAIRVNSVSALQALFKKEPDMTPAEMIAALNSPAGQAAIKNAVKPYFVGSDDVDHRVETIVANVTQGAPYYTGKGHAWPALARQTNAAAAEAPDGAALAKLHAHDQALQDEPEAEGGE